jgi:branched-chain amino acid transport system substrate-binding protein
MKRSFSNSVKLLVSAGCVVVWTSCVAAVAQEKPVKIGVVTFLSGPAAAPFGVPAKNGADVLVEALNAGKVPGPYVTKGIGGGAIELTYVDEAGGTTKQVTEYRNLVQRDVDLLIGYISSGDCLAIAPVAEELKKLTVLFDCGTPRVFEDASYHYVFRTGAMATMDNVAAALYVTQAKPNLKKVSGINQNYAWGQDSWNDFDASMKVLKPGVEVATAQWPQFLSGQYGTEISALLSSGADVVHSSLWGGDLDAFILQATPRGLFTRSTVVLTAGGTAVQKLGAQIPDGTIVGARGPFDMFAPDTPLNRWFRKAYQEKFGVGPTYPAYKMVQAILGVKSAYEKAKTSNKGKAPTQDQIITAFENLTFEAPGGKVAMATGKGHQAVQGTAYGTIKHEKGQATVVNITSYPAEKVTPPDGVKSEAWIKAGLKKPS